MNKKAQAAMEFLMTYGWAILVVLAAIGALVYFGVLSPDKFLPEKCDFETTSSGLNCEDKTATTAGNITIVIKNGGSFDMTGVSLVFTDTGVECQNPSTPISLPTGEQETISIACDDPAVDRFSSSNSFKSGINISYTNSRSGLSHVRQGEIIIPLP